MKSALVGLVLVCMAFVPAENPNQPPKAKKQKHMTVEIWTDIVCPWCYIGKREFEKALSEFEHKEDVEVIWRSYELDPQAPKNKFANSYDMLAQKYGVSLEQSKQMHQNVSNRAKEVGLNYVMETIKPTNSFDAHRLLHLAKSAGLQDKAIEKLSSAYFTEGKLISNGATLVEIGVTIGLPAKDVEKILESNAFEADVREDEKEAKTLGITGVPFFAVNRKFGISGAQKSDYFLNALRQIWNETPVEERSSKDKACTPEGECAPNRK